jgi:hypothetical protein
LSFDYWWISIKISDEQHDRVLDKFLDAGEAANKKIAESDIFNVWKEKGSTLIGNVGEVKDNMLPSKFGWAFNSDLHVKIAQDMMSENFFGISMDESSVIDFLSLKNAFPVSIFAYGLGPDTFLKGPGVLGNLLVRSDDVQELNDKLLDIERSVNTELMSNLIDLTAGQRSRSKVSKIISFNSNAASYAMQNQCGFLTIALPQQ